MRGKLKMNFIQPFVFNSSVDKNGQVFEQYEEHVVRTKPLFLSPD
jgi:hypothetical protein